MNAYPDRDQHVLGPVVDRCPGCGVEMRRDEAWVIGFINEGDKPHRWHFACWRKAGGT